MTNFDIFYSILSSFFCRPYGYPILLIEGEWERERESFVQTKANLPEVNWIERMNMQFFSSLILCIKILQVFFRIVYSSTNDLQMLLNCQKLVGQHTKVITVWQRIIWWNLNYILWMRKLLLRLLYFHHGTNLSLSCVFFCKILFDTSLLSNLECTRIIIIWWIIA